MGYQRNAQNPRHPSRTSHRQRHGSNGSELPKNADDGGHLIVERASERVKTSATQNRQHRMAKTPARSARDRSLCDIKENMRKEWICRDWPTQTKWIAAAFDQCSTLTPPPPAHRRSHSAQNSPPDAAPKHRRAVARSAARVDRTPPLCPARTGTDASDPRGWLPPPWRCC